MRTPEQGAGHGIIVEVEHQGNFRNVTIIEAIGIDPGSTGPLFKVPVTFGKAVKEQFPLRIDFIHKF